MGAGDTMVGPVVVGAGGTMVGVVVVGAGDTMVGSVVVGAGETAGERPVIVRGSDGERDGEVPNVCGFWETGEVGFGVGESSKLFLSVSIWLIRLLV